MLQRGFLGWRQFKPSFAHKDSDLIGYDDAIRDVFKVLGDLDQTNILDTPMAHSGFSRLTSE
jgi:hypothetical protein